MAEELVEVELLPVVELGRILVQLRGMVSVKTKASNQWPYRRVDKVTRRYTDAQIQALLDITPEQMRDYVAAFDLHYNPWTGRKAVAAVVQWARKNRRWPVKKDFEGEGLPSYSTWLRYSGPHVLEQWLLVERNTKNLHPQLLLGIRNTDIRQRAIDSAGGVERLIQRGGATKIQQDDYGTLWEMPPERGTSEKRAVWLEVVNSTAEPDGTFEHFFLRVPPTMTTAKNAVEWSFDLSEGTLEGFTAQT